MVFGHENGNLCQIMCQKTERQKAENRRPQFFERGNPNRKKKTENIAVSSNKYSRVFINFITLPSP